MQIAFYQSEFEQPHPGRARAIIKAHPEVRELMVRNPWTALIAISIVGSNPVGSQPVCAELKSVIEDAAAMQ